MIRLLSAFAMLLFLICPSAWALRAADLVPEADRLYAQLSPSDPQRRPVGLRLADLLFDAGLELFGDGAATAKQMATAESYRTRALHLYEEALPHLTGSAVLRVKFQMSRLYSDLGQFNRAQTLWRELSKQTADARIRRESALRLAEQLELSNSVESIQEAGRLYTLALPLADKQSLRSYIYYRLSWTQFRTGESLRAVETLRASIKLADKHSRDDMAKDLVLFLSRAPQPAEQSLPLVRAYEKELEKPGLAESLAEAYLAADRRADYAAVLKALNKKEVTLDRSIGLLDVRQDQMQPAEIEDELKALADHRALGARFADAKTEKRSGEIYFRLLMLWDGQRRAGKPGYAELFTRGVQDSLILFPGSEDSKKAVSGWLAATPEAQTRFNQMDGWIALTKKYPAPKLELLLRQTKLELARELKLWPVVAAESEFVEVRAGETEARAARYQHGKALYELKRYPEALPLFEEIADGNKQDDLTRFSQDLILDIHAQRKDYDGVISSSTKWAAKSPRRAELLMIGEKARFEQAAESKDEAGLKEFSRFCFAGKFLPKSCANARALAVELKNETALISVLKAQGDDEELTRQLEVAGRFEDSARRQEKKLRKDDWMGALKVAMLYELQGNLRERDRVLKSTVGRLAGAKIELKPEQQYLLYQTLADTRILNAASLQLPFSADMKSKIAAGLYLEKKNPALEKVLLASCEDAGAGWEAAHLARLEALHKKERAIGFIGAKSQTKFSARVKALKDFAEAADCFRKSAPDEWRAIASARVGQAYTEFTGQIRSAPIPDGLDEATLKQVHEQIEGMSEPFDKMAKSWQDAAATALAQVPQSERPMLQARMDEEGWAIKTGVVGSAPPLKFDWQAQLADLQKDPFAVEPLERLKAHFEQKGSKRLAAYIGGRIQGLEQQ